MSEWCTVIGPDDDTRPALDVGNGVLFGFNPSTFVPGAWLLHTSTTRRGTARYSIMPGPRTVEDQPLVAAIQSLTEERDDLQAKLKDRESERCVLLRRLHNHDQEYRELEERYEALKAELQRVHAEHARHGLSVTEGSIGGELAVSGGGQLALAGERGGDAQSRWDRLARWFGSTEPDKT